MAEHFASAVEQVATKVGSAVERAFETHTTARARAQVDGVGERVASAIGQAIENIGGAIPRPDPHKEDKKLLKKRDEANTQMILFTMLWLGISVGLVAVEPGRDVLLPISVLAGVFGALVMRAGLWKRSRRRAIERAQARVDGEFADAEPPTNAEVAVDDVADESAYRPVTAAARAADNEALQIGELVAEMGERDDIREAVAGTMDKVRELDARRGRLAAMLSDPDLADLPARIEALERRIAEADDPATRDVYEQTLGQLRSQADSLDDVQVMIQRLDAYLDASLQSLRTIHIDLLRLQTGDLDDPDHALGAISARAGALGMEIKSVREVVEEVDQARRQRARAAQRQI